MYGLDINVICHCPAMCSCAVFGGGCCTQLIRGNLYLYFPTANKDIILSYHSSSSKIEPQFQIIFLLYRALSLFLVDNEVKPRKNRKYEGSKMKIH